MKSHLRKYLAALLCISSAALFSCSKPSDNTDTEPVQSAVTEPAETTAAAEETPEPELSWQDLYDQGMEYFADGNYEEAITALTASIEKDPKQAPVYVSRGDAYVRKEAKDEDEAAGNLDLAWKDYETAAGLDQDCAEAYLGMADIHIRHEAFQEAYDLLTSVQGSAAEDPGVVSKIEEIESGSYVDSSELIRRKDVYAPNGTLTGYRINEYDFLGRRTGWRNYENYRGNGIEFYEYAVVTFDEKGLAVRNDFYSPDGTPRAYQTMEYDERGLEVRRDAYNGGVHRGYYLTWYDDDGKETGYDTYDASGKMVMYVRNDFDEQGNLIQENEYNPDGSLRSVTKPSGN